METNSPPNFIQALREGSIKISPPLSIVLDFDGTLTRIRRHASKPRMAKSRIKLLESLAGSDDIDLTVLSGRPVEFLKERVPVEGVRLIPERGVHLSEDFEHVLEDVGSELDALAQTLYPISLRHPGTDIERKPTSLVFHYRNVPPKRRKSAIMEVRMETIETLGRSGLLQLVPGRMMLEFLPAHLPDKGDAIRYLIDEAPEHTFIFFGDDMTDEPGFEVAASRGFGILIASNEKPHHNTNATYRLNGIIEVDRSLKLIMDYITQ